jgi:type II secretory pathway component HofQ
MKPDNTTNSKLSDDERSKLEEMKNYLVQVFQANKNHPGAVTMASVAVEAIAAYTQVVRVLKHDR